MAYVPLWTCTILCHIIPHCTARTHTAPSLAHIAPPHGSCTVVPCIICSLFSSVLPSSLCASSFRSVFGSLCLPASPGPASNFVPQFSLSMSLRLRKADARRPADGSSLSDVDEDFLLPGFFFFYICALYPPVAVLYYNGFISRVLSVWWQEGKQRAPLLYLARGRDATKMAPNVSASVARPGGAHKGRLATRLP